MIIVVTGMIISRIYTAMKTADPVKYNSTGFRENPFDVRNHGAQ